MGLDFQIFVCQTCSGLHREFGHKIKSLSFSEWSAAEVAKMEEGGNEAARQKWLDRWNQEAFPEPDGSDLEAVREFIRLKYVEKKWFRPHGKPAAEKAKEAAAAAAKVEAAPAAPVKASAPLDLLSGGDEPPKVAPAPRAAANVAQAPDLLGAFDSPSTQEWTADFSAALPAPKATPKAPGDLEGLIDLDFSTGPRTLADRSINFCVQNVQIEGSSGD
ncbi:unnamed protein product [Effrenium voratum]|nr:unnamed protein product [Effrenium voratum]